MENKPVSVWKGAINPALIFGFVLIIYTLVLYFLDQSFNRKLGWISFILIVGGVVYGIKVFRDDSRNGVLTYGQGVGAGTVISLYAGIIVAIFGIILYTLIDPDLINKFYTFLEEQMISQGRMPESMIEQQMIFMKKIMTPVTINIFGIFNYVFYGVLISLIASIFMKKEGDGFEKAMAEVEDQSAE
jgi:hypothetical protein